MESISSKKSSLAKRISGSQTMLRALPGRGSGGGNNEIVRYSKWDDLPKIVDKKSFRSVPTTLEIALHKDEKRNSR